MKAVSGSIMMRRQLGRRLRRLREASGRTISDVESAKLASAAKLWRIESGRTPVKVADVRALCWLYGADERTTDELAKLAVGTLDHSWWQGSDVVVPPWFRLYVDLEAAATLIRHYESGVVPGILQTADYARAVFHAAQPDAADDVIDQRVETRLARQRLRDPSSTMVMVLDGGVLDRQVGGAEVMTAQVRRLRDLDRAGTVEIRVLTPESGAHAAMGGAFTVLDFADPEDPDIVYVETHMRGSYLEEPAELAEYRRIFGLVYRQAVPLGEYR